MSIHGGRNAFSSERRCTYKRRILLAVIAERKEEHKQSTFWEVGGGALVVGVTKIVTFERELPFVALFVTLVADVSR